jgi:hypothetical protein
MRTKLSDRERAAASGAGLGLSTLLIFADYASSDGRWTLNINCVLFSFSSLLFLTFLVSAHGLTAGSWRSCSDRTGLGSRAGRPSGQSRRIRDQQAK